MGKEVEINWFINLLEYYCYYITTHIESIWGKVLFVLLLPITIPLVFILQAYYKKQAEGKNNE